MPLEIVFWEPQKLASAKTPLLKPYYRLHGTYSIELRDECISFAVPSIYARRAKGTVNCVNTQTPSATLRPRGFVPRTNCVCPWDKLGFHCVKPKGSNEVSSGTGDSQRGFALNRGSARIIRNSNPYFYSASGRFAQMTRISDSSATSPDFFGANRDESIRANHATKNEVVTQGQPDSKSLLVL